MKYLIAVDAAADIDEAFFREKEIVLFPMDYSLGEEMVSCQTMESEEQLKTFYKAQASGELTRTSQITPYLYRKYVSPYLKEGTSVLYLTLSSGLSSTYSSACNAAVSLKEEYPDAEFLPVDSLAATGGMGILAERAVRNLEKGLSLQENAADLKEAVQHLQHWFLVSDMQYLKRGGRVSASAAAIASVLSIKPILQIDREGKLPVIGKARGTKPGRLHTGRRSGLHLPCGRTGYRRPAGAEDPGTDTGSHDPQETALTDHRRPYRTGHGFGHPYRKRKIEYDLPPYKEGDLFTL